MNLGVRALWNKTKLVLSKELHANTSPVRLSLSLALGVFVGLSPFYGIHTVIVLALAFILRLNRPLALIGSGITLLPFVPLWIAAGIFVGKIVVPVETASRIIDFVKNSMTPEQFWGVASGIAKFCKRLLPHAVFDNVDEEASHGVIDGFVQWLIGCSVFAVIGAVVTFAVCYFILVRREAVRRRKLLDENG
ncbi:MAG: DUF2062 domain-containing protein [Chitinispirillaceae bacterium]|jgi:uncharacterized protein (DUF2062 family)